MMSSRVVGPRKQLPFEKWPRHDQEAWNQLFEEGDIFEGEGAAYNWSDATRLTNRKNYARWLAWLNNAGHLDNRQPWERATREALGCYTRALLEDGAPRTAASYLIGLKCVLQKMAPNEDWSWLKMLTNRLDSWAKPSRSLKTPDMTLVEMFNFTIIELRRLSQISQPEAFQLRDYRDTLIVALLIACPLRLRNLTMMEMDKHLLMIGEEWHLKFEPTETKNRMVLHLVVPAQLTPFIHEYLSKIRPAFPGTASYTRVWAARKRKPMACESIYRQVMLTTKRLFGVGICPHSFRSLAATMLAESSPQDALFARPLLGHRLPATTEKYYIKASQLNASQNVSVALNNIRDAKHPEQVGL